MTKTITEWLKTIEDPDIRARALANRHITSTEKFSSLYQALGYAFNWRDSNEDKENGKGFEYWNEFHDTTKINN